MKDTSHNMEVPLTERVKPCKCGAEMVFARSCGVYVCVSCRNHDGLERCYCGWSVSGRNGRRELIEMGETIDEEET